MDLEETYVVVPPGDDTNTSLQWIVVHAEPTAELRQRATDAAWQEDVTADEPLEAVAAYDREDIAHAACRLLNQAAQDAARRHADSIPDRLDFGGSPLRPYRWGHRPVTATGLPIRTPSPVRPDQRLSGPDVDLPTL